MAALAARARPFAFPSGRAARRGGAAAAGPVCASLASELADARGNMAAAELAVPALPNSGGAGAPSGTVPVLFCFSVFARPSSVPHGAGYELLIQKFLSLYGDQIDMHRKFVVQLFAEEWGQYVDLPKGFAVSERCKVRLVPLQIQVGPAGGPRAPPRFPVRARPCLRPRRAPQVPRAALAPGPARLAGFEGLRRDRSPRGRPSEWASPKVTVTSCPRPKRGRGPPSASGHARTPPRVWSSTASALCARSKSSRLRNRRAVRY